MRKLSHIMRDQVELKGVSIEDIAHNTGIPETQVDAMIDGRAEKLPPLPYMKNQLKRLSEYLELDFDLVLEAYRSEFYGKISGAFDQLPKNRFALPSGKKRMLFVVIFVFAFVAFGVVASRAFKKPELFILTPDPNQNPYIATTKTISLSGRINPQDKLFINGVQVSANEAGAFEYAYRLEPELNLIEFRVKSFLGRSLTVAKQVYLQVELNEESIDQIEPKEENASSSVDFETNSDL